MIVNEASQIVISGCKGNRKINAVCLPVCFSIHHFFRIFKPISMFPYGALLHNKELLSHAAVSMTKMGKRFRLKIVIAFS